MYEIRSIWFRFISVAWVVVGIHPVVDDAVVPGGGRAKYAEEAGIDDDGHDHRHHWPLGVLQGGVPLSDDAMAMVPITTVNDDAHAHL